MIPDDEKAHLQAVEAQHNGNGISMGTASYVIVGDDVEVLADVSLAPDAAAKLAAKLGARSYDVKFDDKNRLVLPRVPHVDDVAGHCAWLTNVFSLDPAHPITTGRKEGVRGPKGHVVLDRADAPPIRFEPATKLNAPRHLIERDVVADAAHG